MDENRLRTHIREKVEEYFSQEIDEISTTGNVAGYLTPNAFAGDKKSNSSRIKKIAKMIGYSITDPGKEDIRAGDKLNESYHEYKADDTRTSQQKIGQAISEVNKQLKVIEKIIRHTRRLKKEKEIGNNSLWKRTQKQMVRLENRLMKLAAKLREMRV